MTEITTKTEEMSAERPGRMVNLDLPDGIPLLQQIYLYIIGGCNLNCRHCWIDPVFEKKSDNYLSLEKIESIAEQALPLGLQSVKITGGEPFLHPDLCRILEILHEMGIKLSIETNGTLIGSEGAAAIKKSGAHCSVSLDGHRREIHDYIRGVKGAFASTIQGITHLRECEQPFQIIMSLYRGNAESLQEFIHFVSGLGASSLKVNTIVSSERSDKMKLADELLTVPEVIKLHNRIASGDIPTKGVKILFDIPPAFKSLSEIKTEHMSTCMLLNLLGILHNGHAGICGISTLIPELDFGDIVETGLRKIWLESEVLKYLRNNFPDNLKGICSKCIFKKGYCRGKCIACTYREKNDLLGGFSFCEKAFENGLFPETRLI